jgi:uncharacterized protein YjbJ (UPF0337 family)
MGTTAVVRKAPEQEGDAIMSGATDKVKHALDDAEGKAKEALGRIAGDRSTEAEGKKDQAKADLKQAGDKVKDAFKH